MQKPTPAQMDFRALENAIGQRAMLIAVNAKNGSHFSHFAKLLDFIALLCHQKTESTNEVPISITPEVLSAMVLYEWRQERSTFASITGTTQVPKLEDLYIDRPGMLHLALMIQSSHVTDQSKRADVQALLFKDKVNGIDFFIRLEREIALRICLHADLPLPKPPGPEYREECVKFASMEGKLGIMFEQMAHKTRKQKLPWKLPLAFLLHEIHTQLQKIRADFEESRAIQERREKLEAELIAEVEATKAKKAAKRAKVAAALREKLTLESGPEIMKSSLNPLAQEFFPQYIH